MSNTEGAVRPEQLLVYYPTPVLQKVATLATVEDLAKDDLVEKMFKVMNDHSGVGIAAPQIGVSKQVCIVRMLVPGEMKELCHGDDPKYQGIVMLNPEVSGRGDLEEEVEGCLSCPGISAHVHRKSWVVVKWTDEVGIPREMRFGNYAARIVQHEVDHLQGLCIINKLSPVDKITNAKALKVYDAMANRSRHAARSRQGR